MLAETGINIVIRATGNPASPDSRREFAGILPEVTFFHILLSKRRSKIQFDSIQFIIQVRIDSKLKVPTSEIRIRDSEYCYIPYLQGTVLF